MTDPKTIPERFDTARDGAEFAGVLQGLFAGLEKAMDDDDA